MITLEKVREQKKVLGRLEEFQQAILDVVNAEKFGDLTIAETCGVLEVVKHNLIMGCEE
jgi:hypothetical protein